MKQMYNKHIRITRAMLAIVLAILIYNATSTAQEIVYEFDFNHLSTGQYNEQELEDALVDINFCNGADEGRVYISSAAGHGNALDVKFPEGGVKTGGSGINTKWYFNDGGSHEELYYSYSIYIPANFEWATGGKLPGLGYQTSERNMSLRLMWREEGLLEFYVHYNTTPTNTEYQASINWSLTNPYDSDGGPGDDQVKLKKGQWNDIKMYFKLNTPGQEDGIMRGWLNGELAIDVTDNDDMRTASEGDIKLNCMYFSAFFGTSVPSPVNTYMFFDDLLVTKEDSPNQGETTIPVSEVTLNPSSVSLLVGQTQSVLATVSPSNATNKSVSYSSSNASVATVNSSGVISAVGAGSTIITVTTADGSKTDTCTVTVTNNGGGSDCNYEPMVSALPSINTSFSNIFVSDNGPDLSSIRKFSINWNLTNNGLYTIAFNTDNGVPNWYVDMKSAVTHTLNTTQPSITVSGSGISGFDGDYYAIMDGDNLILEEKYGAYSIYFSNSIIVPDCDAFKSTEGFESELSSISVYPNPVSQKYLNITGLDETSVQVIVTNMLGKTMLIEDVNVNINAIDVSQLKAGTYILIVKGENTQTSKLFNKL